MSKYWICGLEHADSTVERLSEEERKEAEYERMENDLVGVSDGQEDESSQNNS